MICQRGSTAQVMQEFNFPMWTQKLLLMSLHRTTVQGTHLTLTFTMVTIVTWPVIPFEGAGTPLL